MRDSSGVRLGGSGERNQRDLGGAWRACGSRVKGSVRHPVRTRRYRARRARRGRPAARPVTARLVLGYMSWVGSSMWSRPTRCASSCVTMPRAVALGVRRRDEVRDLLAVERDRPGDVDRPARARHRGGPGDPGDVPGQLGRLGGGRPGDQDRCPAPAVRVRLVRLAVGARCLLRGAVVDELQAGRRRDRRDGAADQLRTAGGCTVRADDVVDGPARAVGDGSEAVGLHRGEREGTHRRLTGGRRAERERRPPPARREARTPARSSATSDPRGRGLRPGGRRPGGSRRADRGGRAPPVRGSGRPVPRPAPRGCGSRAG